MWSNILCVSKGHTNADIILASIPQPLCIFRWVPPRPLTTTPPYHFNLLRDRPSKVRHVDNKAELPHSLLDRM